MAPNRRHEIGWQTRLSAELVHTRRHRALPRFCRDMSRQGNDRDRARRRSVLKSLGDFPSVHFGQAKVEDDYVWPNRHCLGESFFAVACRRDTPPLMTQELRIDVAVVFDVIDDEDQRKAIEMTALETAVLPSWKVARSVLTPLHD